MPVVIPPDPLARLRTVAGDVAASLEFFSGLFGPPVMKTLTVAPIPGTFGQGFPGLVYLSTFAYIDPLSRPAALRSAREEVFFSDLMVPHEVAHQWWGSIIESRRIEDEWLLEALANYSSLLWLEKKKSVKEMASVLNSYRTELLSKDADGAVYEAAGPIIWGERLPGWPNNGAWRVISYGKGTWILHMLRRRMGDDAFFKLLAELRRRYEFKSVTTARFHGAGARVAAEGHGSGSDRHVLRELGIFDWDSGSEAALQRQGSGARGEAFRDCGVNPGAGDDFALDTPVEVQFAKGPPQTIWVRTAGDERNFTANLRQIPTRVVIPDEVLKK